MLISSFVRHPKLNRGNAMSNPRWSDEELSLARSGNFDRWQLSAVTGRSITACHSMLNKIY